MRGAVLVPQQRFGNVLSSLIVKPRLNDETLSPSILLSQRSGVTKGFVLILKNDLTWPFFNNSSNKFKVHARLSKVRISIRAASLNVLKDRRKDILTGGSVCSATLVSMPCRWSGSLCAFRISGAMPAEAYGERPDENSENNPRGLYFSKALFEGLVFGGSFIRTGLYTE